jgi:hypothetical protein
MSPVASHRASPNADFRIHHLHPGVWRLMRRADAEPGDA